MLSISTKFFLVCFLFGTSLVLGQQQTVRPNIIWIVSEDNSPFIGAYGDRYATTPNIDRLASEGVLFENAYCTAAVCAPSRSTLITGVYPPSVGTENMRSEYPLPAFLKLFPYYLREAGYYTSNNAKKDYNTVDQPEVWDESGRTATYANRKDGQPFFAVFNIEISHESSIFDNKTKERMLRQFGVEPPKELQQPDPPLRHHPDSIVLPPYHPETPEMRHDWALYYDKIEEMDAKVGSLLKELEEAGLAENTIVFYYGDNGGVLGRSKRFMYESGLRIPLIVRVPEKYRHLNPYGSDAVATRLVDFADFAPTVLQLSGISIPGYYQGKPFLGQHLEADDNDKELAFGFRGRMDERIDLVRTIRYGQYRYVRNFMPHRPYGQHIQFLWLAKSMASWEKAFNEGKLNETQARFFLPKPVEELYDVVKDPHNIHNLAQDPAYQGVLDSLRKKTYDLLVELNDVGFIPEGAAEALTKTTTLYDYARSDQYDVRKVLDVAWAASEQNSDKLPLLLKASAAADPVIRYWAATGLLILKHRNDDVYRALVRLSKDEVPYVRIVSAEALYGFERKEEAIPILIQELHSANNMVRLQALNALVSTQADELKPHEELLKSIVEKRETEYDVKAAQYLLTTKFGK